MSHYDEQRSNQIKNPHKRHYNLCYFGNGSDSAKHHQNCHNGDNQSCLSPGNPEAYLHRLRDGIGLRHVSHTKGSHHGKDGKKSPQYLTRMGTRKRICKGIHGTAHTFPLIVLTAVLHGKHTLRQLRSHSDNAG